MKPLEIARSSFFCRLIASAAVVLAALFPAAVSADMPNHAITPGDIAERDTSVVCQIGEARRERNVSYRVRDQVYLAGVAPIKPDTQRVMNWFR